jgi:hypothetical protein
LPLPSLLIFYLVAHEPGVLVVFYGLIVFFSCIDWSISCEFFRAATASLAEEAFTSACRTELYSLLFNGFLLYHSTEAILYVERLFVLLDSLNQ